MTDDPRARLDALHRGFRSSYLRHDEIGAQLRAWAGAFPELVRLSVLGHTAEGREIWMLTIGPEPDRARPAAWIDGNMHASEVAGSSVALAIAEDLLALHLGAASRPGEPALPPHLADAVRGALVHVVPRISPDGAEAVLTTGRYVRSVPRDDRPGQAHPRWIGEDVDGDGLVLAMRVEDAAGDFVAVDGVMVPRELDDPPPYYRLFPEGRIEHWDGSTIPVPGYLSDTFPDLNRNFPFRWRGEPAQPGAGAFPTSEPEARAVVDFAVRTPTIYAWLNLHTFGGCFIRPPGDAPDSRMSPFDLAVYRQVGAWAEAITGYPMVSGYQEFLYEPDKPLYGALSEWAYEERGALAYVCELWDLMARIGIPRPERFVDWYVGLRRQDWLALGRWDREENASRIFRPWKKVEHPQLGAVEVGGVDRRVGLFNPSYEALPEVCAKQSTLMQRVVALLPRIALRPVQAVALGGAVHRIATVIENHGYLPTYGMQAGRELPHNEPVYAELVPGPGLTLADPSTARRRVGHLEGWGRGLGDAAHSLFFPRSQGSESRSALQWIVQGRGTATIRAGSCRTGWIERRVEIGG